MKKRGRDIIANYRLQSGVAPPGEFADLEADAAGQMQQDVQRPVSKRANIAA